VERLGGLPETFLLDPKARADDVEPVRAAAADADTVLVSLFVRVRAGSGKLVLPDAARTAVESLAASGARLVGVSFGNPYLAADLPGLATYLAAYGDQPVMQAAVARALFGEAEISGRLPVTIPGVAERGSGITRAATSRAIPRREAAPPQVILRREAAPPHVIPGREAATPHVIPGREAAPPHVIPGREAVTPHVILRREAPKDLVSKTRSLAEPVPSELEGLGMTEGALGMTEGATAH
jgi:hypothetical protein